MPREKVDPAPTPKAPPAERAMASRQRLTGSAVGIGSVGFEEPGAFDVYDPAHDPTTPPDPEPV